MKSLLTCDNHVDASVHGRFDSRRGFNTRSLEFLSILKWLVKRAEDEGCESFIIAGDLFNSTHPSLDVIKEVNAILNSFKKSVYIVAGNHEVHGNSRRTSPIDLLQGSRIKVARKVQWLDFKTLAVPYPIVDQYLTEHQMRLSQMEKEKLVVQKVLEKIKKEIADKQINPEEVIIVGHLSVEGASLGIGQRANTLDFEFPLAELANLRVRAILLGHIHIHQVFTERPHISYIGAPSIQEFGQSYLPSYYLVDDEKYGSAFYERFIIPESIAPRPKVLDINVEDLGQTQLVRFLAKESVEGGIVRFRLSCSREKRKEFSEAELREACSSCQRFFIVWIHPDSNKPSPVEIKVEDSPESLVNQYLNSLSISSSMRTEVLKVSRQIMSENYD